jgi:hypothetical protein
MLNFLKSLLGVGAAAPLDRDLVAHIRDNLKREPSDQLLAMLDPSAADKWSPEAVHAARLLLEQRAQKLAPEPVYRTAPRTAHEQAARERETVAPRFNRRLLALDVGSRVYCRWRNQDGTIIRWDDEKEDFYIRYENGDGDWATFSMFEEF